MKLKEVQTVKTDDKTGERTVQNKVTFSGENGDLEFSLTYACPEGLEVKWIFHDIEKLGQRIESGGTLPLNLRERKLKTDVAAA